MAAVSRFTKEQEADLTMMRMRAAMATAADFENDNDVNGRNRSIQALRHAMMAEYEWGRAMVAKERDQQGLMNELLDVAVVHAERAMEIIEGN